MKIPYFRWAAILIAIISFGIAAFFVGKICYTEWEYAKGDSVYEELIEEAVMYVPEVPDESPEPDGISDQKETGNDSMLLPEIDFSALKEINQDVIGWLYLPDTVISYPVVQGEDNVYYLKHLADGTYNSNGCLFVDHNNQKNFTDDNTLIYGHHMNSGKMFASLVKYKEQSYYDEHPIAYLLTPEKMYRIEFFAGYTASVDSSAYMISLGSREEKIKWLKEMFHKSDFDAEVTVYPEDSVVTFSTCEYSFQNARYVVHGRLVEMEEGD